MTSGGDVHVVIGASGCVGAHLVKRLVARGSRVRALVRREGVALPGGVEAHRGDLLRPETLAGLGKDAKAVYYLAHAMGAQPLSKDGLEATDRAQARHALAAVREDGAPRVLYVSGLGARRDAPSAHLRGRWAVEDEIETSGLPYTVFRAGVLLGPGSVGFEVLVQSVRQPIVPLPRWTGIVMQPFALSDLLDLLIQAPDDPRFANRVISVGTRDRTTYAEYLKRAAKAMGQEPRFVSVPGSFQSVASIAMARQTGIPRSEADALAESLVSSPLEVEDGGRAMRELGIADRTLEEALALALRDAVAERGSEAKA